VVAMTSAILDVLAAVVHSPLLLVREYGVRLPNLRHANS
jgi:hypothetical protein